MSMIVKQARTWLGTPFLHQGRVKLEGCDCIGLVAGVAHELALSAVDGTALSGYDKTDYSRVPDGALLKQRLDNCLMRVDDICEGDIVLMRFTKQPQHVGIVSCYGDGWGLIHCYAEVGKVVEHRLDALWRNRVVAVYRVKG